MAARANEGRSGAPDNSIIAEWLALEAEKVGGRFLQKALRKASRAAFLWPEEARDMAQAGRSLTELPSIGPFIEKLLLGWFEKPPPISKPPPLRLEFLTLSRSRRVLAKRSPGFLRGDLQMHTNWSDGSGTVLDMARAAQARGYEYIGITDHSSGLKIARGIDEGELERQGEEIAEANEALASEGFRVLKSIEMNLSPNGAGDMTPLSLRRLDLVVGSFHSRLRVTEDQTERYLAALRNPDVHILGHPRGRIYNYRLGLKADWARVLAEAARLDKAVELDSYPDRQDLNVSLLKLARDAGVKLAIDTDAHHPEQLGFIELGLAAAALVGFPPERIVNFMPADKLLDWVKSLRKDGGGGMGFGTRPERRAALISLNRQRAVKSLTRVSRSGVRKSEGRNVRGERQPIRQRKIG